MDGVYGREVLADAGRVLYTVGADVDAFTGPAKGKSKESESAYTNEPSAFDKFVCFLSGLSYTGGSEFDANGKCQVKGKLIERNRYLR